MHTAYYLVSDVLQGGMFEGAPPQACKHVRFLALEETPDAVATAKPQLIFSFDPKTSRRDRADDDDNPVSRYTTPGGVTASLSKCVTGALRFAVWAMVFDVDSGTDELFPFSTFPGPFHERMGQDFDAPLWAAIMEAKA